MCLRLKDIYATFTIKTAVNLTAVIIDLPSNKI